MQVFARRMITYGSGQSFFVAFVHASTKHGSVLGSCKTKKHRISDCKSRSSRYRCRAELSSQPWLGSTTFKTIFERSLKGKYLDLYVFITNFRLYQYDMLETGRCYGPSHLNISLTPRLAGKADWQYITCLSALARRNYGSVQIRPCSAQRLEGRLRSVKSRAAPVTFITHGY